jgi:hypothetical protein
MTVATSPALPIPAAGPREVVPAAADVVFDWSYRLDRPGLVNLYEKAKTLQWNAATDIDWSIPVAVWERLGSDVDAWVRWSLATPFMTGFRQLLFSKIVPNLKRLGLLTPRVRTAFERIGVLQFEDLPDSTQDETVSMPPAVMQFLAGVALQSGQASRAA